ncbi:MAG: CNNM domain-containing protein [Hyphomicrobiales bacterium]
MMSLGAEAGFVAAAIAALVFLAAMAAATSAAFTACSRQKLQDLERRGDRRAAAVLRLKQTPERLEAGLVLVSLFTNLLATALATAVWLALMPETGALYAALAMTVAVFVFAEVLPRALGAAWPEPIARALVPAVAAVAAIAAPLAGLVEQGVRALLVRFGADPAKLQTILSSPEELRSAIDLHSNEGSVVKHDRDMLGGVLDLKELDLFDIMVHRTKMRTLDAAEPPAEIIAEVLKSGHSRFPVWRDTPDNIIGILHARDLFAALHARGGDASKIDIADLLSPPWFVPDTTTVADQLNAFLKRKTHFALLVDEYGEVMGLITLEDIIEEIVGDIADEHDVTPAGIRREASGSFIVDGTVPIRDLNRLNDWSLPDEEATTIAGLVIHEAQMIPAVGQAFTFHGFRFEVLRKRRNQLTQLRVTPLGAARPDAASAA